MNDKFTIRDFFAYFFCGCAFYIALFIVEFNRIINLIIANKDYLKDNSTVIVFLSLPIIYFTGQIVQSIDTPFYIIGSRLWKIYKKHPNWFWKGLYLLVCSHRVSGKLNLRNIDTKTFWDKCNELTLVSKYGHGEYWYIMNDLFKGVTLISFSSSCYSFLNCKILLGFILLFSTFIFWVRARYFATIFIDTILSTRDALDKIKPENVK